MQTLFLLSTLLALRGAAALGLSQDPPIVGAAAHTDELPPGAIERKQRQVMYNFQDVQYFAYLTIGGQPIAGIMDTGSFDLVVFDQACDACGKAGKYSSKQSLSYKAGMLKQSLAYGSGSVEVYESTDQVAIGPYGEVNLTFWDGMDAVMPVLRHAAFNAIVGVGPPETPAADAWASVEDAVLTLRDALGKLPLFPDSGKLEVLDTQTDLATVLGTRPTLVKADDVAHFSICLGQKPGSVGYFIWNDTSYLDTPSLFTFIKVLGRHTWTVNMTSLQLDRRGRHSEVLACKTGCGAIVDSGTSLVLMPYPAIDVLRKALENMAVDCDNIHTLPKLTFKLDGKELSLPPDAYITRAPESSDDGAASSFQAERVRLDIGGGDCELAVQGSRSSTAWGPLWILGMPFFRSYYSSFQMGKSHDERALFVAPASEDCTPAGQEGGLAREAGYEQELRRVNRSAIFIPRIVHRARTEPFLGNL